MQAGCGGKESIQYTMLNVQWNSASLKLNIES